MTRRSSKAIAIAVAATAVLVAADLGTKGWAVDALSSERIGEPPPVCEPTSSGGIPMQRVRSEEISLIEGYLGFSYAENCGAAFGLLNDSPDWVRRSVFGLAALAAAIALFWMFAQGKGGPLFPYSVPLIVSGAVGNLVDRVRFGYVVDFIDFHWQDQWTYPTFNVADITITIGVVLLLLDGFRKEEGADDQAGDDDEEADDEEASASKPKPKRKRTA